MPRELMYDEHRPETFPAYRVALRLRGNAAGESAVVGLKDTGLDVYGADGRNLFYDLEGRLTRVAEPEVQWRRGLSHRVLELRKRSQREGGGVQRRLLDSLEIEQLVNASCRRTSRTREAMRAGHFTVEKDSGNESLLQEVDQAIDRAASFDAGAALADVARFRAIYDDVPILPPDQYTSVVLMATEGCRYNSCTFCGFYRGSRYREKTPDEFQTHLQEVVRYHGRSLAQRRGIFLGQANALMGTQLWRESILERVNRSFELLDDDNALPAPRWWKGSERRFTGITSFLDAFAGTRITAEEFAAMRRLNLRRLFIGMETGDPKLLEWLRKPATPQRIVETVSAAKKGGVQVGVIVLVGAGGERFFDGHVNRTVELIHQLKLAQGDFIYLSPLVDLPETEYVHLANADGIKPLSPERLAEQEQLIRAGIRTSPTQRGPYVARYEVANFVY